MDANKLVGVLNGVNQDTDFNLNVSNIVIKELKNAIQGPLILTANIILFQLMILATIPGNPTNLRGNPMQSYHVDSIPSDPTGTQSHPIPSHLLVSKSIPSHPKVNFVTGYQSYPMGLGSGSHQSPGSAGVT